MNKLRMLAVICVALLAATTLSACDPAMVQLFNSLPSEHQAAIVVPTKPSVAQWAALRKCESGGDYRAVSASGKYRGAYQFSFSTWASNGGKGDPAAASPLEQDLRARRLYSSRGPGPWPVCGRHLR